MLYARFHGLQTHEVVKIIHQSMVMQPWKHIFMCTNGGAFVLCMLVASLYYDLTESVRVQGYSFRLFHQIRKRFSITLFLFIPTFQCPSNEHKTFFLQRFSLHDSCGFRRQISRSNESQMRRTEQSVHKQSSTP